MGSGERHPGARRACLETCARLTHPIQNGPLKALVADSLPKGERSGGFTKLFVASLLPRSVGPLISVVMFSRLGDDW